MAKVRLNVGVNTTYRGFEERFLVNTTSVESWNVETTLDSYASDSATLALQVFDAILLRRSESGVCATYFDVWLENVTHPTPAAGVVVLPKANITGLLNDEEVTDATVIASHLNDFVSLLRADAKY